MAQDRTRVAHALVLLAPALLLGLLIGAQAQSQSGRPIAATRYNVPLVEAAFDLQTEQQQLKSQLADLRAQLYAVGPQGAALDTQAAALHEQVEGLRVQAGLAALDGAGVTVTLDDLQVGGWKREAMPTRYIGKYDESELQAFPTADLRSLLRGA